MRTLTLSLAGTAAILLGLGVLFAQPDGTGGGGPRAGGPASRPSGPPRFPHLIPPFAAEKMNLTDDQRKQLDDLAKEVKAKLEKILTPEQMEILREARPPRMGPGGPGNGQGGQGNRGGQGGQGGQGPQGPHGRQGGVQDDGPPPPQD
jgi:hypothetical protein